MVTYLLFSCTGIARTCKQKTIHFNTNICVQFPNFCFAYYNNNNNAKNRMQVKGVSTVHVDEVCLREITINPKDTWPVFPNGIKTWASIIKRNI